MLKGTQGVSASAQVCESPSPVLQGLESRPQHSGRRRQLSIQETSDFGLLLFQLKEGALYHSQTF